jgi:5-methylcytosine-specific restriction endonuclease McrA
MAARRPIPKDTQTLVRQRANCLCEYCHASEQWQYVEFTIEHIIPLNKNG